MQRQIGLSNEKLTEYMAYCVELAKQASLEVNPPIVGAVVISPDGKIIGKGYRNLLPHTKLTIHAERAAINNTTGETRGCTLVTTLEPCMVERKLRDRTKIFEPCSELIVKSGIVKVIYGIPDNSLSMGCLQGVNYLRTKGIEVVRYEDPRLNDVLQHLNSFGRPSKNSFVLC